MFSAMKTIAVFLFIWALRQCSCGEGTKYALAAQISDFRAFKDSVKAADQSSSHQAISINSIHSKDEIFVNGEWGRMDNQAEDRERTTVGSPLSQKRKREIQMNLSKQKDQIDSMRLEYRALTTALREFETMLFTPLRNGKTIEMTTSDKKFLEALQKHHALIEKLVRYYLIEQGCCGSHEPDLKFSQETSQSISRFWVPKQNPSLSKVPKTNPEVYLKSASSSPPFNQIQMEDESRLLKETIANPRDNGFCHWYQELNKPWKILFKYYKYFYKKKSKIISGKLCEIKEKHFKRTSDISEYFSKENLPNYHENLAQTNLQGSIMNYWQLPPDMIDIVLDKMMSERISVLKMTFIESQQILQDSNVSEQELYNFRVCAQKFVLQSIQSMFKLNVIRNRHLKVFFNSTDALETTGSHIFNLFKMKSDGFSRDQPFFPEVNFLCNHQYTCHLHETLAALGTKEQGEIIHTLLRYTVFGFEKAFKRLPEPPSKKIHKSFLSIIHRYDLEYWLKTPKELKSTSLIEFEIFQGVVHKMICYYMNPAPYFEWSEDCDNSEYLINHYLLKYIKTYHQSFNIKELSQGNTPINYNLFEKQFHLLEAGLEFHQRKLLMSQGSNFPRELYRHVKHSFTKPDEMMRGLNELSKKFRDMKQKIHSISQENPILDTWLHGYQINEDTRVLSSSSGILRILSNEIERPFSFSIYKIKEFLFAKIQPDLILFPPPFRIYLIS